MTKQEIPYLISKLIGDRPVRWAEVTGNYDGNDRTIEVFETDVEDQRLLFKKLRSLREQSEENIGGPLVIIFHTKQESKRLYQDFIDAWHKNITF